MLFSSSAVYIDSSLKASLQGTIINADGVIILQPLNDAIEIYLITTQKRKNAVYCQVELYLKTLLYL